MGYDDREERGTQEGDGGQPQQVTTSALSVLERAQLDVQISTAKAYPRSIKKFKEEARAMALLDEETAASCFYAVPRDGKMIEGPSVRLGEIVASSWGNIKFGTRIIGDDGRFITAQAVCHDLEKNVAISCEVKRRITNKSGRRYSEDMIQVTGNAAASIALRNAVFRVVPFAYVKPIYEECRRAAVGDVKTLGTRRANMVAAFLKMGVTPERICVAVGKPAVDDITLDDLATLLGLFNAIKEGAVTPEEAFPDPAVSAREEAATPAGVAPNAAPANTLNPDAAAKRKTIRDLKLKVHGDVWAKALAGVGMTPLELGGCDDLPTLDAIIEALGGGANAKGGAA
ncbi:MAG: hypothetical protein IT337_11080 [Thermomicrobiales bacterium]|nr:hypothetical protein [Thermomicrobiales bacterium]